jgi:hypothetical protein
MTQAPDPPKNASKLACIGRPLGFAAGFVGVIGILWAIGNPSYRVPDIQRDHAGLERMKTGRHIVFGSSHGYNVDVEAAGFDGVNMSHGGQDVFEQVYMAREVKRTAPNLELVVFTLSYFSFVFDNAAYFSSGAHTRAGRRVSMYATFPSFRFIRGDGTSWVKGMLSPVVTPDHWKRLVWPTETKESETEEELQRAAKRYDVAASEEFLAFHAKKRCRQYARLMKKMVASRRGLAEDAFETLRDAAKELEATGVRVVLLTTPYYEAYNACYDAKRQRLTRRFAKRIAHETGAEYIDAGSEPAFANNREYFRNSDHMNASGSAAFSRWLGRQLARREKR